MRFTTTLDLAGKSATGFRVPASVVEALGAGKRAPVVVTINGYRYRNTVAVYGDAYLIGVAAEHRAAAGVAALSYSNRRRITESVAGAKTAETRQRRIDKAVGELRSSQR
jgi:hypothetical protein